MTQPAADSSPQMVAAFIEVSLNELAELAVRKGCGALATTLMLAELEAARAAAGPPTRSTSH